MSAIKASAVLAVSGLPGSADMGAWCWVSGALIPWVAACSCGRFEPKCQSDAKAIYIKKASVRERWPLSLNQALLWAAGRPDGRADASSTRSRLNSISYTTLPCRADALCLLPPSMSLKM